MPHSELLAVCNLSRAIVIVSSVVCHAGLFAGCSVIGYFAGGAIDGPMNDLDSLTATRVSEGTAMNLNARFRYDAEPLAAFLKEISAEGEDFIAYAVASPGLGITDSIDQLQIEIVTDYVGGRFHGARLGLDSVLVLQQGPPWSGRFALFPDDSVSVVLSDSISTTVSGTVSRLGERNIVLRVGDIDRGFALTTIDFIRLSNGVTVAGGDVSASMEAGRAVGVQCLVLTGETRLFIPLDQVGQIRVKGLPHWGRWRTTLTIAGGVVDAAVATFLVYRATESLPEGEVLP